MNVFFKSFVRGKPPRQWTDWAFKPELTEDLHRILKNRSIRYRRDECITLPPLERVSLRVEFPSETQHYVNLAREELVRAAKERRMAEVQSSFVKLQEIASGFVNYKDDDGTTHTVEFDENPKLELLIEKLQELPEDAKALVFHTFTYSGQQITKALTKAKIDYRWLYGGTPNPFKLKYIQDFKQDPDVQVLVLNSQSGALGLNMQHAQFAFFYESPVDPLMRDQAEARIYRSGQTKTTWIYDLYVKDSVEEKILGFLKEGKNLLQELIENRVEDI